MSDAAPVLEALRAVEAPGTAGQNIVDLGLVKDLSVEGGRAKFRVEFPAPLTPARRRVADRCREALNGKVEADVEVQGRIPASFTGDAANSLVPGVKNIIAIGSGKGGVGKSTVSVNVAAGLAKAGAKVGLLDTDVYGPSVPLLMGVSMKAYMEELQLKAHETGKQRLFPYEVHGVGTMSLGYLVEPEKAAIWRGPMVHGAVTQLLRDVEWGDLDYMIIDLPPGTGDVQLTLSQSIPLAGGVIVCTPQPVAVADAHKALNMFKTTKTEVLGLVENMGFHACSACGHRDDVFGTGGAKDAAEEWDIPFLGSLPLDTRVRQSGDAGTPVLATDAEGPLVEALWGVVDRLTAVLGERIKARPRSLPIRRT